MYALPVAYAMGFIFGLIVAAFGDYRNKIRDS